MVKANELDILTRTVWGEARGEGEKGQVAVAWVIKNRVNQPKWWGKSYISVCKRPWQFSCWNADDPNYPFMMGRKMIPVEQYQACEEAVKKALYGDKDPTKGATHYYNPKAVKTEPKWVEGATLTVTIGAHKFYKNVP